MASAAKEIKGYIKTENMILIAIMALAVGFFGGVMYSAYRSTGTGTAGGQAVSPVPVTQDQQAMLTALNERIKTNPDDVEAWTQLGHLQFDLNRPKEAIAAYEHSLSLQPGRPDVWTDLGVMYRRNGQPAKAVEMFDQALKLEPHHQIALFNKGIVLMHDLSNPQQALQAWEKLLSVNPNAQTPGGEKLKDLVQQLKQSNSAQ